MQKIRKNRVSGFALLQVLLAIAIVLGVGSVIAGIINYGTRSQKALQAGEDARTITNEIALLLSDSAACINTFGGQNPTTGFTISTTGIAIRDSASSPGNPRFYVDSDTPPDPLHVYGNRSIVLSSLNMGGIGTDPQTGINKYTSTISPNGVALVVLTWAVNGAGSAVGSSVINRYFMLKTTLDGSSNITTCSAIIGDGGAPLGTLVPSAVSTLASNGSGTAKQLPLWNGTTQLGNSVITQAPAVSGVSAGYVGINNPSPAYQLDVIGNINTTGPTANLRTYDAVTCLGGCASDFRVKKDIRVFPWGLEALQGIKPKYYKYNGLGGQVTGRQDQLGVIAQDLERTLPSFVSTKDVLLHPEDKQKSKVKNVIYGNFIFVAINAIQDLFLQWSRKNANIENVLNQQTQRQKILLARSEEISEKLNHENRQNKLILHTFCTSNPSMEICR